MPELPQGDGARDEAGERADGAPRRDRQRGIRALGPSAASRPEDDLRVGAPPDEAGERTDLVECRALVPSTGLAVAPDLRLDGVAQSEALVAQLGHELGIGVIVRPVGGADRFEEREGEESVDRGGHRGIAGGRGGSGGVAPERSGSREGRPNRGA
ncbi:MAG TPA: hypothetical protein VGD56_07265 [Gemmatirosa sp.]